MREQAGLLEQVTAMGDSLREAQAQLDGEALRDLTKQRRRLVAAVTAEVGAVAAEHDHPLSAAASRQVEETVQAALVDERAAVAVRSGVLVTPLASTGVESLAEVLGVPLPEESAPQEAQRAPGGAGSAAPDGAGEPASVRPALSLVPEDEEAARREAEQRAADRAAATAKAARRAEKAASAAEKARDKALAAKAKAQARLLQLEAEAEELRLRLAEVETRAEEAASKLADRDSAAEVAVSAADAAAHEAEEARKAAEAAACEADASPRA